MHAPTPLTIAGAGVYLPRERRASAELDRRFGQAEGWTETQFGIRSRGVAADDETTSFMAARAAEAALAQAGWAATDINALIGACGVMEQPIPGVSILVQERLGLGRSGVWAFDVNQTCLSFLTALDVVAMGFSTGRFRRALVVSSDIASAGLDWSNPASSAIFGDGAAAFCFEAADDPDGPALLSRGFESYGEGKDLATLRSGGTRLRIEDGLEALTAGARFEMVDLVICHQASHPGVEHIRRLMGGDPQRVIDIFADHGNQIAASLPTVLARAREAGRVRPGTTLLLLGTAAGISAGAVVLRA